MATSNKTINTRVQLKSDTEENWKKSVLETDGGTKASGTSFVPLMGELIIYTADSTHPFSRLKVGNGLTNVVALPFIDSATVNGVNSFIEKYINAESFPQQGSVSKLYIDLTSKKIYHYSANSESYIELLNVIWSANRSTVTNILEWSAGTATSATINSHTLQITAGTTPTLRSE